MTPEIDFPKLRARLDELGATGRDGAGRLVRTAFSDADRAGRDLLAGWMKVAGVDVEIDAIGNIAGVWRHPDQGDAAPVVIGSHIDTVIDAGIYDGCYGVLAGLAVIEAMREAGLRPVRPVAVMAFSNEEGVRFAPDMMGSLVAAGGLSLEEALDVTGTDGLRLGDELTRIGYAGLYAPGHLRPHAYLELHVEQGPVLEAEGIAIGAVEALQGISWQSVRIDGDANHAGTTPTAMRSDAGLAAARVNVFLRDLALASGGTTVATVGTVSVEPGAINVIPASCTFTIDLRDPDEARLLAAEAALAAELERIAATERVSVRAERLARFEPVTFDADLVARIEAAAAMRGVSCRRMTSGAGHDAQMIARTCPSAMIFVPSRGGISHNPEEHTDDVQLKDGAAVLLDVVRQLVEPR